LPKDEAQAVSWYRLASQQGDEWAAESLRRLGKQ
jgi:TPR repeat protein